MLVFVAVATVFAINLIVDPFNAYREMATDYFDPGKRRLAPGMAEDYLYRRPDLVLFGTSRVGMGLSESCAARPNARIMKVVLYGSHWYEQSNMLRFIIEQDHRPDEIVIGTDFFAFSIISPPGGIANFDKSRFSPDYNPFSYHAENLVSAYALAESLEVAQSAITGYPRVISATRNVAQLGNGHLFAYMLWRAAQPAPFGIKENVEQSLRSFERSLRAVQQAEIKITIVFLPTHVLREVAIDRSGQRELINLWKQRLVGIAARIGEGRIAVWDFQNCNPVTTEIVPKIGDLDHPMKYFYDPYHFTQTVGQDVLMQMLGDSDQTSELGLIGVRLTLANVQSYLQQVEREKQAYAADHPDQIEFFDQILSGPPPQTRSIE